MQSLCNEGKKISSSPTHLSLVGRKVILYFTSPSKQQLNLQAGKLYTSLLTNAFYPTFGNELLPATAKSHVVSWNITPGLDYCDIR